MAGWLGLLVGILAASATALLLDRAPVRRILGLLLLGHAVNLAVFGMAGGEPHAPPLIAEGASAPAPPYTDPIPQALVLTALVIGFAVQAFALVLFLVPDRPADDVARRSA